MARTKQTARKSTGGKAPRRSGPPVVDRAVSEGTQPLEQSYIATTASDPDQEQDNSDNDEVEIDGDADVNDAEQEETEHTYLELTSPDAFVFDYTEVWVRGTTTVKVHGRIGETGWEQTRKYKTKGTAIVKMREIIDAEKERGYTEAIKGQTPPRVKPGSLLDRNGSIPYAIPENMLKRYVNETIYERGRKYYEEGKIVAGTVRGNEISGTCKGSGEADYDVFARFAPDGRFGLSSCTCPWGQNNAGRCKHLVALLMKWLAAPREFLPCPIETLPRDIIDKILWYMTDKDIPAATRVCKMWYESLFEKSTVWRSLSCNAEVKTFINCGHAESFALSGQDKAYTIEAMVKGRAGKPPNGMIVSKVDRGVAAEFALELVDGKARVFRNKAPYILDCKNTVLDADKWYHLAVTYNGLWCTIYINGINVASTAWTAHPACPTVDVCIGAVMSNGQPESFFDGWIHEVRLWSTCRSDARIVRHMYRRPDRTPELVAHWVYDGKLQGLTDISGNQHDGILVRQTTDKPAFELSGFCTYLHNPIYPPEKVESSAAAPSTSAAGASKALASLVSTWNIPPKDIKMGALLGTGSFGAVYKGVWRGSNVAVKKILTGEPDEQTLNNFRKEIEIMSRLRPHPHVVQFLGACATAPDFYIVTELLSNRTVESIVMDPSEGLSLKERVRMGLETARGMLNIHAENLIHQDLACRNLLVSEQDRRVKVTDFGLSRLRQGTLTDVSQAIGTPATMAPELIQGRAISNKIDVYSYGVILWELYTRQHPWAGMAPMQIAWKVVSENKRPDIPGDCPRELRDIIQRCWAPSPKDRPSFEEVIIELEPIYDRLVD